MAQDRWKRNQIMVNAITVWSDDIHDLAKSKGFWEDESRTDTECIVLMHCELSEAVEGLRHGNPPSEHIPEFSAVEEELADCVIRIMDLCGKRGYRLGEAMAAKMEFNQTRPHKHGKKF